MYRIVIDRRAVKEIEALPDQILQNVWDRIEALKGIPRPHDVKKLIGQDGWRIRISTYRVLYTIDDKHKLITIYRVKHRKDVYR
ncbi:MAG: type II toxin-antitoxin system RelE/ParE family toxin [Candidatus Omnitrophica bacterium]|nr:type II toxin-antitoxin system RelE/ParE family toxin [Candidatus Omnitrophota bacterium]